MLELGKTNGQNPPAGDMVIDVTEATFMADVIDASQEVPVIVDFWAPWCGPCKTLGPMLEEAVAKAGGKVRMAKVNVDENQQISAQLRIQSIPTVYAFWQGQPVDGFQGAVPGSEIKAFVDRLIALGGGTDEEESLAEAVAAAEEMLEQGAAADAVETFAAILSEDPENAAAHGGIVRAHIVLGDLDQAEAFLNGVPAEVSHAAEVEAAHAALELARQGAKAGPVGDLEAKLAADPGDHQTRFDLAQALYASGMAEDAVDHLLTILRQDRDWQDGAARTQLFTIFDALGPKDPVALNGRRKLSSILFA